MNKKKILEAFLLGAAYALGIKLVETAFTKTVDSCRDELDLCEDCPYGSGFWTDDLGEN